jgi:hypothetical protein
MNATASRHDEEVLQHRMDYFTSLGYAETLATLLAESAIDPHRVEALLGQGCEPETAARILWGTDALGDEDTGAVRIRIEDEAA